MRYEYGKKIYDDVRIYEITCNTNESLVGNNIDKNSEVLSDFTITPSQDCSIKFVWVNQDKNQKTQYNKLLKANCIYEFENLDYISDIILVSGSNIEFEIMLNI